MTDYKFYCFHGAAKFLYVSQGLSGDHRKAKMNFVDLAWKLTPFQRKDFMAFDILPVKSYGFDEMCEIASVLSRGIPFVRVDLYSVNRRIYFSEFTFSPSGGFAPFSTLEWGRKIGGWIRLPMQRRMDEVVGQLLRENGSCVVYTGEKWLCAGPGREIMSFWRRAQSYISREWNIWHDNISYYRNLGTHIGEQCIIHRSVNFGSEPYLITLGNHVRVNKGVEFITHDGGVWVFRETVLGGEKITLFGCINVGNNVHIGTNAIIMPNVHIGNNCVIGCGAVVTHDVPDNKIVAGVPAHIIESVDEYWQKNHARFDYTKQMDNEELRAYLTAKYCVKNSAEERG